MEIMAVILHQVTDHLVATIKTPKWAGVAEVQKEVVELSSQLSPRAQTPTFRISEWHWPAGMSHCFMGKKQIFFA